MASKNFARRRTGGAGSKTRSASRSGADTTTEQRSRLECPIEGCDRTYANERTLARHVELAHPPALPLELTPEAVERTLATITIADRDAVTVAVVRRLAKTLETCEDKDAARLAKELTSQMAVLLDEQPPPDDDWTEDE